MFHVAPQPPWTSANAGSNEADELLRILTPLLKFRACRDNIPVATGAMEVRGGNGYIEEWVNARLVRDAQIGVLWEGTSNINALDIVTRAVGKSRAHRTLEAALRETAGSIHADSGGVSGIACALRLTGRFAFAERAAAETALEASARQAAGSLYHIASAILMAVGSNPAEGGCAPGLVREVRPRTPPGAQRPAGAAPWRMGAPVRRTRVLRSGRVASAEAAGLLT